MDERFSWPELRDWFISELILLSYALFIVVGMVFDAVAFIFGIFASATLAVMQMILFAIEQIMPWAGANPIAMGTLQGLMLFLFVLGIVMSAKAPRHFHYLWKKRSYLTD